MGHYIIPVRQTRTGEVHIEADSQADAEQLVVEALKLSHGLPPEIVSVWESQWEIARGGDRRRKEDTHE